MNFDILSSDSLSSYTLEFYYDRLDKVIKIRVFDADVEVPEELSESEVDLVSSALADVIGANGLFKVKIGRIAKQDGVYNVYKLILFEKED